ncbi:MAG: hypothetical protein U5R06_02210 [candidate division KSB1 bacterium]|nr:hypothetical protein [candidate division KSB1 bacterium]
MVTDELVTMLQNLIEDVKEYTLSMLNEPDSLYQTIRTGEQQWRQNITNELDNVKDRMFKHQDNNYPLGTRYVPDENELESLFATGFKRLKPEKVAELLGSGNININQLFEDQAFDLDNLISVLKEDIYGIFEPFYRNLVFDDQTLFQFGEIQNSQRELMQKASPLLKHDESNLNTQSYRYCINPVDEANWRLSDYNNMTGNNPLKYTVFEYRDGIPGTVIFHIENWHDLYTDFIRKRKTDANPTGDDTIRPLHLFRDPIFFETYIPQRLVSMIKDKKTASNLAEAVFQAACKRNVIVAHNGSFKYHGVMAFGPTSRDDFVNEMSNNLSFLWDLYEAIYDVIKFTEDVPKSLRELNKEILEETLKGSKAE